jgi:uncharacterized protein (DUF4415 family)
MAKKLSALSRPARRIRKSAESIWSKPLSRNQKAVLGRIAKRQKAGDQTGIEYSDIPALTAQQLAEFYRPKKVAVTVRLDADLVAWMKAGGPGYQTRVNAYLRGMMRQGRKA